MRVLYRPENTQFSWSDVSKCDVNMLFWTDDVQCINATKIEGKCFVLPKSKIEEDYPFIWTNKGKKIEMCTEHKIVIIHDLSLRAL